MKLMPLDIEYFENCLEERRKKINCTLIDLFVLYSKTTMLVEHPSPKVEHCV